MQRLKKSLSAVGVFCTLCIFAGCSQESLIFLPEKLPLHYKFTFSVPFEEITLPAAGGTIHALHFKAQQPKGIVLFFHGNAGSLRTWGEIAGDFTTRGYDLLIPDYRGFGKSTGNITSEEMLLKDGLTVYEHLRRRYPEERIVLYGRSIGTGIAAYVAGTGRPRLLILESPYYNLIDVAGYHYPLLPDAVIRAWLRYPLRTDLWIKQVACPIVLLHGKEDMIIAYDSSERLCKIAGNKCRLIRFDRGGHNDLGNFPLYQQTLSDLLP